MPSLAFDQHLHLFFNLDSWIVCISLDYTSGLSPVLSLPLLSRQPNARTNAFLAAGSSLSPPAQLGPPSGPPSLSQHHARPSPFRQASGPTMSKTATAKARDPFALKFKGSNKAFAPFAAVGEGPAVAQLWLCAAPVASHLEAGERVANLAWRLWAIHERTVVDESARHRRSFKRLAKGVSERLDRDRARPVHELSLPELAPVLDNGDVRSSCLPGWLGSALLPLRR